MGSPLIKLKPGNVYYYEIIRVKKGKSNAFSDFLSDFFLFNNL